MGANGRSAALRELTACCRAPRRTVCDPLLGPRVPHAAWEGGELRWVQGPGCPFYLIAYTPNSFYHFLSWRILDLTQYYRNIVILWRVTVSSATPPPAAPSLAPCQARDAVLDAMSAQKDPAEIAELQARVVELQAKESVGAILTKALTHIDNPMYPYDEPHL